MPERLVLITVSDRAGSAGFADYRDELTTAFSALSTAPRTETD